MTSQLVQLPSEAPDRAPRDTASGFAEDFSIAQYLQQEGAKDLLRFSTAGSVDDGKSTLIGRLLYDTQSVYDDQVRAIEGKGTTAPGVLDLALLTDGLRAEREQGITIDVAYRYFSTARRKFIIADTPGHEQYTRNMATGASTADVAVVLVDARKGVLVQSRRHASITALLGVPNIIVAVNKMDLVEYSEQVFAEARRDFSRFFAGLELPGARDTRLHFIPVSALAGDNVVRRSDATPWYDGPALLTLLEAMPAAVRREDAPFRMAVQRVVRPGHDFRGFAGQISSGKVRPGDRITVLPSGGGSRVARIVTYDGDLTHATAPLSVTLTLEDEIDISRGDLIVAETDPARVTTTFEAHLVWMDAVPLEIGRRYRLKMGSRVVPAHVRELLSVLDLSAENDMADSEPNSVRLTMNGLARVAIETAHPIVVDAYTTNRHTGSFILIDPQTNATVAAGMVEASAVIDDARDGVRSRTLPVSAAERASRYGHRGAHLALRAAAGSSLTTFADALERALFERGALVVQVEASDRVPSKELIDLGVLVITTSTSLGESPRLELPDSSKSIELNVAVDVQQAVAIAIEALEREDILHAGGRR